MIISHKYRFIFIKTRKTAGTSLEVFLSRFAGPDDSLTPILPHVEPHRARNHDGYFNHMRGHEVRSRIGAEAWNDYFRFCIERNSWDKTLSYYHMLNWRQGGGLSFDDYLASGDFCVDHPAYTEPGNPDLLLVNQVVRYEELTQELTKIFANLGIPFDGSLGVRAKSEYRTDRRPYREVYSPGQRGLVEEAFAREIERFGYAF